MNLDKINQDNNALGPSRRPELIADLGKILETIKMVFPQSSLTVEELSAHIARAEDEFMIAPGGYVVGKSAIEIENRGTRRGRSKLKEEYEEAQYGGLEEEVERRGGRLQGSAVPKGPYKNFEDFETATKPEEKPVELSLAYAILMLGWGKERPGVKGVSQLYVEDEVMNTQFIVSAEGIQAGPILRIGDDPEEDRPHFIVRFK